MENNIKKAISFIVPVYNEGKIIEEVLAGLINYLKNNSIENEIIVVNDGSTDKTKEILERINGIRTIHSLRNKGYGASLKTGVRNAKFDWVFLFDGDGQHGPEYISEFISQSEGCEMIIGSRQGFKGPLIRQPGKKVLTWVAQYLVGQKIPDINSGFRLIKKNYILDFLHLLPNGFSASTTSTIAFLNAGLSVKYVPIKIKKRIGKSTVKQIPHGIQTILLILRVSMLFNPLKVFFPITLFFAVLTAGFLIYDIRMLNVSESTVALFIAGVFIFCVGLLADQISVLRKGIKK